MERELRVDVYCSYGGIANSLPGYLLRGLLLLFMLADHRCEA